MTSLGPMALAQMEVAGIPSDGIHGRQIAEQFAEHRKETQSFGGTSIAEAEASDKPLPSLASDLTTRIICLCLIAVITVIGIGAGINALARQAQAYEWSRV